MKTIFVVDDSDTNLSKAEDVLGDYYNVMTIPSGAKLFSLLDKIEPHLILLDIEMPGMGGFEVLTMLKAQQAQRKFPNIPVIFLTGLRDAETEARGFEEGVVDFITKPFSPPVLLNRVQQQISVNELIKERTAQLEKAHRNLIFILADIVESRDEGTGGHIERTVRYITLLVKAMIAQGVYADELLQWDLDMIPACAILHDIGKIGISDLVLNKDCQLTPAEFDDMKSHALNGARIIDKIIERNGEDEFLYNAKLFAEYHHENWDGSGYPHGLKGTKIPLHGRIMAIADVYDALISARPYKESFSDEKAVSIILEGVGKRFDPMIVTVFHSIRHKFKQVRLDLEAIASGGDKNDA